MAADTSTIDKVAKSVWFRPSHNAGKHGSDLDGRLKAVLKEENIDFGPWAFDLREKMDVALYRDWAPLPVAPIERFPLK